MLLLTLSCIGLDIYLSSFYSFMSNKVADQVNVFGLSVHISQSRLSEVMTLEISYALLCKEPFNAYQQRVSRIVLEYFFIWPRLRRNSFASFVLFYLLHCISTDHYISSFSCLQFLQIYQAKSFILSLLYFLNRTPLQCRHVLNARCQFD